jgi:hypothetical protein
MSFGRLASNGRTSRTVWASSFAAPLVVALALAWGHDASAGVWAVVGADVDADRFAAELRGAVVAPVGTTLLDTATLHERLSPPRGPVVDVAAARALLAAADAAFQAVEHERSISYLESLIVDLERDTTFSAEKLTLLQTARLQAARQLLGLAGPKETGRAETSPGKRALVHLEAALRADPTLVLDPARTPPKLRALLSLATEDVKRQGYGSIAVQSTPPGATVLLEGREVGLTPLVTAATIASGRYRLWVEKDGRTSLQRSITVGSEPVVAEVNLVVEGALRPAGPGLARPLVPLGPEERRRLVARVDVDRLIIVGREDDEVWAVAVDRGGVLLALARSPEAHGAAALADLAAVVADDAPSPPDLDRLPTVYFQREPALEPGTAPLAASLEDGPSPLALLVGIGGVLVVSGAVAGTIWLMSSSPKPTVGVTVRRAP